MVGRLCGISDSGADSASGRFRSNERRLAMIAYLVDCGNLCIGLYGGEVSRWLRDKNRVWICGR